jgi:hypothetical protein
MRSSVHVVCTILLGLNLVQAGAASRAYAQTNEWFHPPEQSTRNAPPIVHDLFAPQELPIVKEPPRNNWFYPPEQPAAKAPPTVHELTLPELDAKFRSFAASVRGMEQLPYFDQLLNSNRYTQEQATELMKDRTILTFDKIYGPQIEYTSAHGISYLWYPGNQAILRGQWYIRDEEVGFTQESERFVSKAARLCFYYGPYTYNPSTRRTGEPECQNAGVYEARVVESRAGDVLGLSGTDNVPFVLGSDGTSIENLLKQLQAKRAPR